MSQLASGVARRRLVKMFKGDFITFLLIEKESNPEPIYRSNRYSRATTKLVAKYKDIYKELRKQCLAEGFAKSNKSGGIYHHVMRQLANRHLDQYRRLYYRYMEGKEDNHIIRNRAGYWARSVIRDEYFEEYRELLADYKDVLATEGQVVD